jgi:DDE superfamily endonuclease
VVLDNYATHKHAKVQAWLGNHPRVRLHVTPTDASWRNLVEVFFSLLQLQALRRGDVGTVEELVAAIRRFGDGWTTAVGGSARSRTPTSSWHSATAN